MHKLVAAVVVSLTCVSWAACPPSGDITPCTCREETPGRTMDCSSVTSSSQLQSVFSHQMPDPAFQYFQIVKITGRNSLEKIPANVFGATTFMFVWFGQTDVVIVEPQAFSGNEMTMLELTLGDASMLTSFAFEHMADLNSLYKLFISNSALDSIPHVGAGPNLTQITVSGSQVSSISPGAFADLGRMNHLTSITIL